MRKKVTISFIGLFICISVVFSIIYLVGRNLCKSQHCSISKPVEIPFIPVSIKSKSGSVLKGWALNSIQPKAIIVLFHSLRNNRSLMIDRADMLWRNGYSVLLFDFQAHGESGGKKITFGHLESYDVESIYEYTHTLFPDSKIGAIGISLGGAAIALQKHPQPFDAVILEAVYPTIEEATQNRIKIRLGNLAKILTPVMLNQLKLHIGLSKDDLKPIDAIQTLHYPLFIIAGKLDRHTTVSESERLFSKANEPKSLWIIDEAAHEDFYTKKPEEYQKRVLQFFDTFLQSSQTQTTFKNNRE